MNIKKIHLDSIERCYSASYVTNDGINKVILASEAIGGPCNCYFGENFENKEVIWENAGGTMSIIEIPNTNGEFLATQKFFPGFNSKESKVVWGRHTDDKWVVKDFIKIPYLHRFDLLTSDDGNIYFIGAVLCNSKKDRDDWSDPGKVLVGILPSDLNSKMELTEIKSGLVKNHGYFKSELNGIDVSYITCESGIYLFTPPKKNNPTWNIEHLLETEISDVAAFDLDGDGEIELATISPFHGNTFNIYKKINGKYEIVYTYPNEADFIHAIWAGDILGIPTVFVGVRRVNCELFYLRYNKEKNIYEDTLIESGVGTSNVWVLHEPNREVLISANHTKNEAAVYIIE